MGSGAGRYGRGTPRWLVLGMTAAVVGALLPAVAQASAGANIRRSPGDSAAFTVAGSNGYSLYFTSAKGQLTIVASQQRPTQPTIAPDGKLVPARVGSSTESTYSVDGVSRDPGTIEADLGPVGRVSLTFQASGEKQVTMVDFSGKTEHCIGAAKIVRRLGNFVGTVSFHGENGYTTAEAVSVPGTVGTSPVRNCTQRPKHAPEEEVLPERPTFLAVSGEAAFFASRDPEAARFMALEGEDLGSGVLVFRDATAVGKPDLFSFKPSGLRASVRPPAPFSGTGVYRYTRAGSRTWSGDLSVAFLGVQRSLTGDGMVDPSFKLGKKRGS